MGRPQSLPKASTTLPYELQCVLLQRIPFLWVHAPTAYYLMKIKRISIDLDNTRSRWSVLGVSILYQDGEQSDAYPGANWPPQANIMTPILCLGLFAFNHQILHKQQDLIHGGIDTPEGSLLKKCSNLIRDAHPSRNRSKWVKNVFPYPSESIQRSILQDLLVIEGSDNLRTARLSPSILKPSDIFIQKQGENLSPSSFCEWMATCGLAIGAGAYSAQSRQEKFSLDQRNKQAGFIAGAILDPDNPYTDRNRQVLDSLKHGQILNNGSNDSGMKDVVEDLLGDLRKMPSKKGYCGRFVCTNTTIEQLGASSWMENSILRILAKGTQEILNNQSKRVECWRIFIIQDNNLLANESHIVHLYATMEENRHIGIKPAAYLAAAIPPNFPYQYADFYCVPNHTAFVSLTPHYILAKFRSSVKYDRAVVDYVSEMSDLFIQAAQDNNTNFAFEWQGGRIDELQEQVLELKC